MEPVAIEDGATNRSRVRVFAILASLYMALFIAAVNTTIITTALPTIANYFHSSTGYIWVGAAYLLGDTASGPVCANFSDIWGRKVVLLASVACFMVASLVCGLANSMVMLITGRAIQGAAAGGTMLLVNIVISDMFEMRRRTLYLGICDMVWAISGAIGPVLGGVFAEYTSWRWIWYTNLPVGGAAFFVLLFCLNVHNPRTPMLRGLKAIDWLGSIALLAVTIMTLLGLNLGGATSDWESTKTLVLICVGVGASAIFFFVEARVAKYPVMPLSVFKNRSNAATIAVSGLHAFAMMGPEFFLPLYFQSAKMARPLRSGLLCLPFVFLEGIGGITSGIIIHRTGRYKTLFYVAAITMTLGFGLLLDFTRLTSLVKIIIYQSIGALGSGLLIQPPIVAIQANVPQEETATATSTLMFVRGLMQAISVVVGGVVFSSSMNARQPILASAGVSKELLDTFSGADAQANVGKLWTIQNIGQEHLIQDAYAWSLRNDFILFTCVAALTIGLSYFVGSHSLSTEQVETRTGLRGKDGKK